MKQMISRRLSLVILVTMLVSLLFHYALQIHDARESMIRRSQIKINQIEQILEQNSREAEKVSQSLKEDSMIRAKAAAYILQHQPEILESQEEMQKIADLLQVDEFHLFDKTGLLYNGSQEKYFGYRFDSGEQMQAFLPMLKDRSLVIAQDMMPNTAEQKMMQYTAVWMENGENIVQIGIEPKRLMQVLERTEPSYVFSMVTPEEGTVIYMIDRTDGQILGSTDTSLYQKHSDEIGLHFPDVVSENSGFAATINGVPSFCVFKDTGTAWIGMTQSISALTSQAGSSMFLMACYLMASSLIMILVIIMYLDRYIIIGINTINHKLQRIADGDLNTEVDVSSTPEFINLSHNLNHMVQNLRIMRESLEQERDIDLLTGLSSRRAFYRDLKDLFRQPKQFRHAVLMMLDLDDLKNINDTYGHINGDAAIQKAAGIIQQISDVHLLTGRLSGDEFSVFLYGYDSREALQQQIDAFYQTMLHTEITLPKSISIPVRLSGGYVFCQDHPTDYKSLLRMADQALYQSKRNGKARFTAWSPDMDTLEMDMP